VDLKRTASVHPAKMQRQISAMCWEMQGAAYREGGGYFVENELGLVGLGHVAPQYGGHWLIAAEAEGMGLVRCYPLDPVFSEIGHRRWLRAQQMWIRCIESGEWPAYPEDPIGPSLYATRTELERYDFPEEEP
jgi:hypothetical protein